MKAVFLLLVAWLVFLGIVPRTGAQERIDFFDREGRRTGYAIVDKKAGRVDFYDANSRRTGWGRWQPSGRAERFDLLGRRQPNRVIPPADRGK